MVTCLKCKTPLVLKIDLEDFKFSCEKCSQKYNFLVKGNSAEIELDKKKLSFFLNDVSFCNDSLSKNTIYDLYNKGYIKCEKVLNSRFNNHDSEWSLHVDDLLNMSIKNYNNYIKSLYDELDCLETPEQTYECSTCRNILNFEKAVNNNFLCINCSKPLSEANNERRKKEIIAEINLVKKKMLSVKIGWS
ncbi:Uncharacterised protein [Candidatus Tiddalikarchaeum anstoanum]|nr:Uncharacterised protein [Candidatus Tiddalikarchaeum anstoanum]